MLRKHRKTAIYIAVLVVPFLIVFFRPKSLNGSRVLDVGARPVGFAQSLAFEWKKFFYYRETYDDYAQVKKQTDLLKAKVTKLEESVKEANRAGKIQDFRRAQPYSTIVASVIGRDPSNWNASLVLDRGNVDGVKIGMPVISTLGVVGKVMEVGHSTSKAVLIADPNFSVAAIVARSRESGLLTGTLQGICRLQYLTENADVKVGDKIVTSKLSTAFPEGVLIGSVVDVQASANSHTAECLVEPAIDLSHIEEVIIIKR